MERYKHETYEQTDLIGDDIKTGNPVFSIISKKQKDQTKQTKY